MAASKRRRAGVVVAIASVVALTAGCGDPDSPAREEPAPKATVKLAGDAYHPRVVRVPVGGRVTWVNRDVAPATVETNGVGFFEYDRDKLDRQNRFDLHTLSIGEAETVSFDTPGRYRYHSSFDAAMRGVVVVEPPRRDP